MALAVYTFADNSPFDVEALRSRLARMDDATLKRFGRSAAFMCSPSAHWGKRPHEVFVIQLREAREEWRGDYSATPCASKTPREWGRRRLVRPFPGSSSTSRRARSGPSPVFLGRVILEQASRWTSISRKSRRTAPSH